MKKLIARTLQLGTAVVLLGQAWAVAEECQNNDTLVDEPVVSAAEVAEVEQSSAAAESTPVEESLPVAKPIVKVRPLFQHRTYPAAWRAAQESNRPILVFVCMPNCHYCVKMKHQVYQQPRVKDLVSNSFETIAADRYTHPKLVSSLKIRLYPTTVLVGPNNKILDVIEGYADANKFQRRLQTGLASLNTTVAATTTR